MTNQFQCNKNQTSPRIGWKGKPPTMEDHFPATPIQEQQAFLAAEAATAMPAG
jgi:hypothetical protein